MATIRKMCGAATVGSPVDVMQLNRFPLKQDGCSWWRRWVSAVLVVLVFAGSVCPALYAGILPHRHIFVGGPPPANWEQDHQHPNPLSDFFGAPGRAQAPVGPTIALPTTSTNQVTSGHVVSVYDGTTSLVVTSVTIEAVILLLTLLHRPQPGGAVARRSTRARPSLTNGPPTPPPRFT